MSQNKYCIFFGFWFWLLGCSNIFSSTLISPQSFVDEVHFCCTNNEFDRLLLWIQDIDLLSMNRSFKETEIVYPLALSGLDTEYYKSWKEKYYSESKRKPQRNSFFLAGEFYPYIQLLQSTALSFYELPPVIRTCIILSGKLGNPIAKNILILEGIDGSSADLQNLLEEADADETLLTSLLQTPFLWNNISAVNFLKEPNRRAKILSKITGNDPFIYLNGYFISTEISSEPTTKWLEKARDLGSALAAIRLFDNDFPEEGTLPASVMENLALQKAYDHRYGRQEVPNRKKAHKHYIEALRFAPMNPFLHMEIAEFYKDLYIADSHSEIQMNSSNIVEAILYHYRQAHLRGDGEAALETIKFMLHLEENEISLPVGNSWDLPQNDIDEAFTKLYEMAYLRREEPIFLERIKKMKKRTAEEIDDLKLKAIRNINHRSSIIRFGT